MGIGDWGLGPIPNPQSPNPQSPIPNKITPFLFYIFIYNISLNYKDPKFLNYKFAKNV